MELELFQFIDKTIKVYELQKDIFIDAEKNVRIFFEQIFDTNDNAIVALHTRIKTKESLKEKLLRNKCYLYSQTPEEALADLSDLIGIAIECRFTRHEDILYKKLFHFFDLSQHSKYVQSLYDSNFFMNLRMEQPQLQKNGFKIYRIDGFYLHNGKKIKFELQIKSLVHRFWSEIEHEVVYKNLDFIVYDNFMKNMLGSVRDSLDVVDRQLEMMYHEISNISHHSYIGIDEIGFKIMTATAINQLVNHKMKVSIGFVSDFKKSASILAQYIYIHDFINGENNNVRMIEYLEHLNYLSTIDIDYKELLVIDSKFVSEDIFNQIFSQFCLKKINADFEWHIFFVTLFAIHPKDNSEDFAEFVNVIRMLLIPMHWYQKKFEQYDLNIAQDLRNYFEMILANSICTVDNITIVHESSLLKVMNCFHEFIEQIEVNYQNSQEVEKRKEDLGKNLIHMISTIFNN